MAETKSIPEPADDEQVSDDVMHLINIANFNGLCRVIAALAVNGALSPDQLENIEDCMSAPLDDPEWRDNSSMAGTRDTLEVVLAGAMIEARSQWLPRQGAGADRE